MVQDSTTYYVWIGGSCDYAHKEPTHEARAETKLVWALPCKKEEDEVNRRTKETQSNAGINSVLQGGGRPKVKSFGQKSWMLPQPVLIIPLST